MPVFFRHSCDVISGLFSEPGCSIRTARGTINFDFIFIFFWQPVQIHIHVHLHLTGTSLCRCCLETDEIPSAPNSLYHVSQVKEAGFAHQVAIKYSIEPNAPLRNSSGFLTSLLFICLSKNESIASLNLRTVSFP